MASTSGSARMEDILFEHEERISSQLSPKHPIFLSHSGAQKGFVEQLYEDLKSRGQSSFFDQSPDSLPRGEEFPSRIFQAAKQCAVAVVVLSEEFLKSKWAMLELATFVEAQETENPKLKLFPLFYKLEASDLKGPILTKVGELWSEMADADERIDTDVWKNAIRVLARSNGERFSRYGGSKVKYRKAIVDAVCKLCRYYGQNRVPSMVGKDRLCGIMEEEFDKITSKGVIGPRILGLYGPAGIGKTFICKALCDHFSEAYSGRTCYVECSEGVHLGLLKLILEELTDIDEKALQRMKNEKQIDDELKHFLPKQDVFLALDNLQDGHLDWPVLTYLSAKSKVIVTSRDVKNVLNVGEWEAFCMPCPTLTECEALKLFLQSAGCTQSPREWTNEEKEVLIKCIALSLCNKYHSSSVSSSIDKSYNVSVQEALETDEEKENFKKCMKLSLFLENANGKYGYYNPLLLMAMGTTIKQHHTMKPMELIQKCKLIKTMEHCERRALLDIFKSERDALTTAEKKIFFDVVLHYPLMNLVDVEFIDMLDRLLKWMEITDRSPRREILSKLEKMKDFNVLALKDHRRAPQFFFGIFMTLSLEANNMQKFDHMHSLQCCNKAIEMFTMYRKSLESPRHMNLHIFHELCGVIYEVRGRLKLCHLSDDEGYVDDFQTANHFYPNNARILFGLGIAKANIGHFLNALEYLNQAILLFPTTKEGVSCAESYVTAFAIRSWVRYKLSDFTGAQMDIDFASALNPQSEQVQFYRSIIYGSERPDDKKSAKGLVLKINP